MNPTVVGRVANDSAIAREELFGPVGVVIPYDGVDAAVTMANDSRFGLSANVWGPPAQAPEVARRIRSGTVNVNGGNGGLRTDAPFGGYRQSGVGREAGEEGFLEFFKIKQIQVAAANRTQRPAFAAQAVTALRSSHRAKVEVAVRPVEQAASTFDAACAGSDAARAGAR